jgi:Fe-S oxidoreductase
MAGPISCCGHPLWRWGDGAAFGEHAAAFAAQVGSPARIVVDDPGCATALRDLYPQMGVKLPEVVTTATLLASVSLRGPDVPWTVHDGCFAKGAAAPRLRELVGASESLVAGSVVEGEAGCCGGMLVETYDPLLSGRMAEHAARDLCGDGAEVVVAASPTCRRKLRAAGVDVRAAVTLWNTNGGSS